MKRYSPLARLYHATRYSLQGLVCAFKQEQAFEYEAVVLAVLGVVVFVADLSLLEGAALIGAWLTVMAFELVNSAVERAFNLIDKEYNLEIKAGKDMLSAAVFLMVLFNIALWGIFLCQALGKISAE